MIGVHKIGEKLYTFDDNGVCIYQRIIPSKKYPYIMFDNDNTQYARFSQLQNATRFETYPMVSIAIVEPSDIEDITYETIRKIMRQNVVSISAYKATHLRTDYITIDNKLIQDVNIYMKDDLTIKHIELTEYGLKWYNN